MKAHEFIRETFDLDNRTSISELPDLPIQLIVEMLNNYKEGKIKKLLIASVSGSALNTNENGNCATIVLANVIYPQLEDIRIACQMIANGIDDLTLMLSKEETEQFQQLASKWMYGFREHKKQVIDGMISELSS